MNPMIFRAVRSAALGALTLFALTGCRDEHLHAGNIFNSEAKLDGPLPYPVLTWKPLTTTVDRAELTTATLFANDAAAAAVQAGAASYPAGSVLALVTWSQSEDPHWFGARIPGTPRLVEIVEFSAAGPKFRTFAGSPLAEQAATDGPARTAAILAMKPIALP